MSLTDKVCLITGAASGIGAECARTLAAKGAAVVIADLNLGGARAIADEIVDRGGRAMAVAMDVTNEDAVEAGMAEARDAFGPLDVLVSNAGIQIVKGVDELALADWRKMLAIHLDGAFLTTRAAVRQMYASGRGGAIIYMGSVHSHEASKLKAPYVTAKHGLLGLARVVAKEGGPRRVRANVVCPGFVRTPLVDKQIPEQARELGLTEEQVVRDVMLRETVDGEFTTLADVAETVAFLAGFNSNALTGQSIVASHGWFMQ